MISIENLTFRYKNSNRDALKQISLTVQDGGFLGIIGPSGAGKSTLAYALNGIIPHYYQGDYYGTVKVNDKDPFVAGITELSKLVGTVFQDVNSQMIAATVEDEILYGLENFNIPKSQIENRIDKALEQVGIANLKKQEIASLSGGQKQKVAIAAVIALQPEILVLDEPTGELDPTSSRQIFQMLRKLNEDYGITVIVIEQKVTLLIEFAKELGVISQGRLVCFGKTRDILEHSGELEEIGIKTPKVVGLSNELKKAGYHLEHICLSVEEAELEVRRVIG